MNDLVEEFLRYLARIVFGSRRFSGKASRWREAEIMELVVKGRLNKQFAHTLGISEKTVKVHRGRVMQNRRSAQWRG